MRYLGSLPNCRTENKYVGVCLVSLWDGSFGASLQKQGKGIFGPSPCTVRRGRLPRISCTWAFAPYLMQLHILHSWRKGWHRVPCQARGSYINGSAGAELGRSDGPLRRQVWIQCHSGCCCKGWRRGLCHAWSRSVNGSHLAELGRSDGPPQRHVQGHSLGSMLQLEPSPLRPGGRQPYIGAPSGGGGCRPFFLHRNWSSPWCHQD